ncbi:LON peptidase substrate-binding domain-containing protein [Mobilicoccus massiliensis]|uniref:LON peptidase substrate-binding domain-containing protein n=1 Tax=Mobilicoccus massiliensis TaxID=1522310 RepID=UPI000694AD34|nr:LON peptidase substrate-binding domain-containing protein [Mobilicoccus massiliensis]
MDSMPLFPLGTVLLPGVRLPLRIFEPRYVAMVAHLERLEAVEQRLFAVVAIRRGNEVGMPAPVFYDVGCSVGLDTVTRREDHLVIETTSRRRVRIVGVHDDRAPYLVADVEYLDPQQESVPTGLRDRTETAFLEFAEVVGAHVDGLPYEPYELTASALDGLGLPRPEQQAVLEAGDATRRLQAVGRLCRRERALAEVLGLRSATVAPSSRLSPN